MQVVKVDASTRTEGSFPNYHVCVDTDVEFTLTKKEVDAITTDEIRLAIKAMLSVQAPPIGAVLAVYVDQRLNDIKNGNGPNGCRVNTTMRNGTELHVFVVIPQKEAQSLMETVSGPRKRVAAITKDGELSIKEGSVSEKWISLAGKVKKVKLYKDRILIIDIYGTLSAKEGAVTSTWTRLADNIVDAFMCENRIFALDKNGNLSGKDSMLTSDWVLLETDIQAIEASGDRIYILSNKGILSAKEGALTESWTLLAENVQSFAAV